MTLLCDERTDSVDTRRLGAIGERVVAMLGPVSAATVVLTAMVLGLRAYGPYGGETALSIALGAGSVAAMSVTLVLAARPPYVEVVFGGLDRIYVAHKWLGISALMLMLGHFVQDPEFDRSVPQTSVGEFASDLGELALYGFGGLILISWVKRLPLLKWELPWPLWRLTHRLTGALFAVVAFHQLAVDTPRGIDPLFTDYLNALSLIGIGAWLYSQVLAPWLRARVFVVEHVVQHVGLAEVTLRPQGRPMRWRPGQFAFVSFSGAGMREPHPFTIASSPRVDGRVTFGIKALGRWTRRIPLQVQPGQHVRVEGPYGRFVFRKSAQRQVWLAGGIGITPFLAWAEALTDTDRQHIALIWAVRTPEEAYAADRLATIAAQHPRLSVHVVASARDGRLTAQRLTQLVPFSLATAELFYCGPTQLRAAIVRGLRDIGQQPRQVHGEAFELR